MEMHYVWLIMFMNMTCLFLNIISKSCIFGCFNPMDKFVDTLMINLNFTGDMRALSNYLNDNDIIKT